MIGGPLRARVFVAGLEDPPSSFPFRVPGLTHPGYDRSLLRSWVHPQLIRGPSPSAPGMVSCRSPTGGRSRLEQGDEAAQVLAQRIGESHRLREELVRAGLEREGHGLLAEVEPEQSERDDPESPQ